MTPRILVVGALAAVLVAWGCSDRTPASNDPGLIPIDPRTIEILLPFEDFADSLQLIDGYASTTGLPGSVVAGDWRGDLDVHTLVRFGLPIDRIFVVPAGSPNQTTVPDLNYRPIEGRVVVYLDSLEVDGTLPLVVAGGAIQAPWHVESTTWDSAIDTLGNRMAWPQPGAGPVTPLGEASWNGTAAGDSLFFPVDSLTVSRWFDQSRPENGLRLAVTSSGTRARILDVGLVFRVRSSIRPDTIVEIEALSREITTIYAPEPPPLADAFRIGGAPAHRAIIHFGLPDAVEGNSETCEVEPCTIEFRPENLVYAGLQIYTRHSAPLGLSPLDTIGIDMRPVLRPDRLPRSPLGLTVQSLPTFLDPEVFVFGSNTLVELPMTRYVRDLLRTPEVGQEGVSSALALLTGFEPWSLEHATFWGPGSEFEPVLRLVFTVTEGLDLP